MPAHLTFLLIKKHWQAEAAFFHLAATGKQASNVALLGIQMKGVKTISLSNSKHWRWPLGPFCGSNLICRQSKLEDNPVRVS